MQSGRLRPVMLSLILAGACGDAAPSIATGTSTSDDGATTAPTTSSDPTLPTTGDPDDPSLPLPSTTSATSEVTATTSEVTTATTTADPTEASATSDSTTAAETTGDPDDTTEAEDRSPLTLQHAQVKGTHNSYHLEPALPFDASHEYSHAPLPVQLGEQGVRAFELDVHKGFSEFEVYHIAVIDSDTTCSTLKTCLTQIRDWSLAHPSHLPVVIWFEIKDSTGGLPISANDLDDIDSLVRSIFAADHLFSPDDLQGDQPSIRSALDTDGWPLLSSMRGRVLGVILNVGDSHAQNYTYDGWTTAGRALFARATPAQFASDWAAIAKLGIGDTDNITAAHAANLLIATNVCGAGDNPPTCHNRLADALARGIHMLKDDFPAPVAGFDYVLELPDGQPARCNPITAPPECTSLGLENL